MAKKYPKPTAEQVEDARRRAEEERRIARQRTLFTMLPAYSAVDRLKAAMLQRAYDLMCEGQAEEADAILEFLPEKDATAVLNSWLDDQPYPGMDPDRPKSKWYYGGGEA